MIEYSIPYLSCKVKTSAIFFKKFNSSYALPAMTEPFRTQPVKRSLSCMPEWRVTKIMTECYCLSKVFIKPQCPCNTSGYLRYLKRVCKPCAVMITLRCKKYLRLMLQSPECFAVDYPVPVPLIYCPHRAGLLCTVTSARLIAE